jgi:hypothetical protein
MDVLSVHSLGFTRVSAENRDERDLIRQQTFEVHSLIMRNGTYTMPLIAVQGHDQVVQERIFVAQAEEHSLGIRRTAASPVGIHKRGSQDRIHIHAAAQSGGMEHFAAEKEGSASARSQNADKQELAGERRRKRTFGVHPVEQRERLAGEVLLSVGDGGEVAAGPKQGRDPPWLARHSSAGSLSSTKQESD